MQNHGVTGVILTSLLWLTGCGPFSPETLPEPPPSRAWAVKLTQSGGFVGVHLIMEVASTGEMTAQDARSGRMFSGMLSPGALEQLDRLLAATDSPTMITPTSMCADCFIYAVEIDSEHAAVRQQVDDTTLEESGMEPLITYLRELRDNALAGAQ
jgi:hypothetical protein